MDALAPHEPLSEAGLVALCAGDDFEVVEQMTEQELADIRWRFAHGQCLPNDMRRLLDAMPEAPPEGYSTWRMYRLEKDGLIKRTEAPA